jgi:hypothetical protein
MRRYVEAADGYMRAVLRIASAMVLVVLVAAGCGSSAPRQGSAAHGVPRTLARTWAARASAIADAAAAGDSCRARQLAASLRNDVIKAQGSVPARLRTPLLDGVNALANRIVCVVPPRTVTTTPKPPKPEPKKHGHDHHGPGGDSGDQS